MRTIPAFGEPQDDTSVSAFGVLKVLYMSHLALGDYIYQGAFLKALTESYPNIKLDIWIDDCRKKRKLGMLVVAKCLYSGYLAKATLIIYTRSQVISTPLISKYKKPV